MAEFKEVVESEEDETVRKPSLELIKNTKVEDLISYEGWIENESFTIPEVKEILKKCTGLIEVAKFFHTVCTAVALSKEKVDSELILCIYENLLGPFNRFLADASHKGLLSMKDLKSLYDAFGYAAIGRRKIHEQVLLKKRLEAAWWTLSQKCFKEMLDQGVDDPEEYEKLFRLCDEKDPTALLIAGRINDLLCTSE